MLVLTRDGVPHVQVRIGNKRCNMIFHPDVRMTLLVQHTTREGESFFSIKPLELTPLATMAGSITVAHQIDASSALAPALNSRGEIEQDSAFLKKCAITVTIVAADTTYAGDVQAIKRYKPASMRHGVRFADVMKIGENGQPEIDFDAFDDVVPLRRKWLSDTEKRDAQEDVSAEVCF